MVRDVFTKKGSLGDVVRGLYAGWEWSDILKYIVFKHIKSRFVIYYVYLVPFHNSPWKTRVFKGLSSTIMCCNKFRSANIK